ncbi:MAG: DUF1570 domain-containing protein, partial [Planctomycetaceae bacterium]|nr:DUF1570 domain-containing protein [Planctomycetaceae bacterium]
RIMRLLTLIVAIGLLAGISQADEFTYRNREGETVTLEARLYGSGQGAFALLKADGQVELVPERAVTKRVPKEGPKPITEEEMVAKLTKQFGEDRFRAQIKSPFVCGLVLAEPLGSRVEEARCRAFLKKANDFMKRVETIFEQFAREVRVPLESAEFPLVLLIFETDNDFEAYAKEITGGKGISASRTLGFYSAITNFLAIRMSECHTFETPLHEAIHQQVYNRQMLKRLAPLPAWFNEGIATGFEGNGDRITNGPVKVNSYYAKRAAEGSPIGWHDLVSGDVAFRGDIFAGDAYTHAWSMHWLLVNQHRDEYTEFVKMLGQKEPMAKSTEEERQKDFETVFGKSAESFQDEFLPQLKLEVKRQKVRFKGPAKGRDVTQSNLAEVDFGAVLRPQGIQVGGKLTNISYIREMAYYVTIETGSGLYADWLIPNLGINRSTNLKSQYARKRVSNPNPGLGATAVVINVHSAPVESDEAKAWARGNVPAP